MKRMMAVAVACAWAALAGAAWGQECVLRAEIRGAGRLAEELRTFLTGTQWEGTEEVFERGSSDKERAVWEAMDRKGTVVFALYGKTKGGKVQMKGGAAVLPMKDSAPLYALLEKALGPEGPVRSWG